MQVTVKDTGQLERVMRVEIPAERVSGEIDSRLRALGRSVKIRGFRPGKIPMKVLQQRYGRNLRREVVNDLVQSSFSAAVRQNNLRPVGNAKIESEPLGKREGLVYTATFEIYPAVEIRGVDRLVVEKPVAEVTEAEVDSGIQALRLQHMEWTAVRRPSRAGDRLTVVLNGILNGQPVEERSDEQIQVILGGEMLEGFRLGLSGVAAGHEADFEVTFPDTYPDEDLAGKTPNFHARVLRVEEPVLPETDAEFCRRAGEPGGSLETLRGIVRARLEREVRERSLEAARRQIFDQLLEFNEMEVPKVLREQEARKLQRAAMAGAGIGDESAAPPVQTYDKPAGRRVRMALLMDAVVSGQQMRLDRASLAEKLRDLSAQADDPEEALNRYYQDPALMADVEGLVLEGQVLEWLLEQASVTEKRVSFTELMAMTETPSELASAGPAFHAGRDAPLRHHGS